MTRSITIAIRAATPADNAALVRLAARCPMAGDLSLCVDRAPDFFALSRIEGDTWKVGVIDVGGRPVACIGLARREVYVNGEPRPIVYIGDLKVDPHHRRAGLARALLLWAQREAAGLVGEDGLRLSTILAGNTPADRVVAVSAADGFRTTRRALLRAHSVQLLWRRRIPADGPAVSRATTADLPDMVRLWREVARDRQLAPVYDLDSYARWISAAPGLDISDFLLARGSGGALLGFLGLWDQSVFKQMRVVAYSPQFRRMRIGFNLMAPLVRAPQLPRPGGELRYRNVVNLCVPAGDTATLRALLLRAYADLRGRDCSMVTIGLDAADPLSPALSGLLAQPTDVHVLVDQVADQGTELRLTGAPVHFEVATV